MFTVNQMVLGQLFSNSGKPNGFRSFADGRPNHKHFLT